MEYLLWCHKKGILIIPHKTTILHWPHVVSLWFQGKLMYIATKKRTLSLANILYCCF